MASAAGVKKGPEQKEDHEPAFTCNNCEHLQLSKSFYRGLQLRQKPSYVGTYLTKQRRH